jgi:NTP pyrophosphatase (non-canonical NTP hydrolase)
MDLLDIQERAWANKRAHGFNTTDVNKELLFMIREMGEVLDAYVDRSGMAGELADVTIFAVCVARMTGAGLPGFDLAAGVYPDVLPPDPVSVQRDLLLLFREGIKTAEAWQFQDLPAVTSRLDGVLTCVSRLARKYCIDLPAAVADKLAVNESRTYVRDDRSGRLVKSGPGR